MLLSLSILNTKTTYDQFYFNTTYIHLCDISTENIFHEIFESCQMFPQFFLFLKHIIFSKFWMLWLSSLMNRISYMKTRLDSKYPNIANQFKECLKVPLQHNCFKTHCKRALAFAKHILRSSIRWFIFSHNVECIELRTSHLIVLSFMY